MRKLLVATAVLLAMTISSTASAHHVWWGASFAPAPKSHHTHTRIAEARYLQRQAHVRFTIMRTYLHGFTRPWTRSVDLRSIVRAHKIALFSFTNGRYSYQSIIHGHADRELKENFRDLKRAGHRSKWWRRAIIGFMNEPDGKHGSAHDYRAAAEHIIRLAHRVGLRNHWTTFLMEWTWRKHHANPHAWIPRNIKYLGVHGYSTHVGSCGQSSRRSFYRTFIGPYRTARHMHKKMIIGEAGYAAKSTGWGKAKWFRRIPRALHHMPGIVGIAFWHSGGREGWFPGGCSWKHSYRLDSNWRALRGLRRASNATIFGRA